MGLRRVAALLGLALAVLIGFPLVTGHPLAAYATSGSMVPTIGVFDGFLVDPYPGTLRVGDIIIYDSVTRGEPVVHRVVGGDDATGWTTRGDANPRDDQDAGEPAVMRERVLGRVVTLAGAPILFPHLGVSLTETRIQWTKLEQNVGGAAQLKAVLFLALAAALAAPAFSRAPRAPARPAPRRVRLLLARAFPRGILGRHLGAFLVLCLLGAGAWAAHEARSEVQTSLVVVKDPSAADTSRAAASGGSLDRPIRVGSLGPIPTLVLLEPGSRGARVGGAPVHLAPLATDILMTREVGGPDVGLQSDKVEVWRYPRVLPDAWTVALHRAAPGSPDLVLAAALGAGVWAWLAALRTLDMPVARLVGIPEGWR